MVTLLLILFAVILIFFWQRAFRASSAKEKDFYSSFSVPFSIIFALLFVQEVLLINTIGTAHAIDSEIAMYEKENKVIEEKIDVAVKKYMNYESSTYIDLKNESSINLIYLFPELKSDTLVSKQIEVYLSNNARIKELKEEQIDVSRARWNLYFGK